jgi:hypothetical protein
LPFMRTPFFKVTNRGPTAIIFLWTNYYFSSAVTLFRPLFSSAPPARGQTQLQEPFLPSVVISLPHHPTKAQRQCLAHSTSSNFALTPPSPIRTWNPACWARARKESPVARKEPPAAVESSPVWWGCRRPRRGLFAGSCPDLGERDARRLATPDPMRWRPGADQRFQVLLVCFWPVPLLLASWLGLGMGRNGDVRGFLVGFFWGQIRAGGVASWGRRWLGVGSSEECRNAAGFDCNFMCPAAFLESPFLAVLLLFRTSLSFLWCSFGKIYFPVRFFRKDLFFRFKISCFAVFFCFPIPPTPNYVTNTGEFELWLLVWVVLVLCRFLFLLCPFNLSDV